MTSDVLSTIGQHFSANSGAYMTGLVALVLAAIRCMPKPGSDFNWKTVYSWAYETLQTVLPTPRPDHPTSPVVPAPAK